MVERRTSESGLDVWMVIGVPALPAVPAPLPPARGLRFLVRPRAGAGLLGGRSRWGAHGGGGEGHRGEGLVVRVDLTVRADRDDAALDRRAVHLGGVAAAVVGGELGAWDRELRLPRPVGADLASRRRVGGGRAREDDERLVARGLRLVVGGVGVVLARHPTLGGLPVIGRDGAEEHVNAPEPPTDRLEARARHGHGGLPLYGDPPRGIDRDLGGGRSGGGPQGQGGARQRRCGQRRAHGPERARGRVVHRKASVSEESRTGTTRGAPVRGCATTSMGWRYTRESRPAVRTSEGAPRAATLPASSRATRSA